MSGQLARAWGVDESYPNVRQVVAVPYQKLPREDLEALLAREGIDAEDLEDFLGFVKSAGKAIGGALPTILPVAGGIVGGAFGGPAGAALGGMAGQLAGSAVGSAMRPSGGRAPAPARRPAPQPMPGRPAPSGSPAAGQLLQMLMRPEVQQALMSMVLGATGRRNIPVGGTPVPAGAFANMLGSLANLAAAEYHEAVGASGEELPTYLTGFAGEIAGDPAVPMFRARRLVEMLQEADLDDEGAEDLDAASVTQSRMARLRAADDYYDALEMHELATMGAV